ncbi:MAG TPA: recombinase family protein [Roseiarcus sp.]
MKDHTSRRSLRGAIYTRVSTDQGLEQDFNSLDAQREASEAYIKSQAHEGWRLLRERYDDGGFSGGSMERPGLEKLLEDVRAHRIDVIVVYKVDRLTRSLADFAKLVELFDKHDVSFISVTQAFNTTTSMGRLTLNMLLSFAQFEREITGERIRDKIAASKQKGIWMGGSVPLGYRVENRTLQVVDDHAAFVRDLFRRYLEIGSAVRLKVALDAEDVRLPIRIVGTGNKTGGGLISRGHIYHILSNPIYVGRLRHNGKVYEGLQKAIVDLDVWEGAQGLLATQTQKMKAPSQDTHSFLAGKLYDDRGNRMGPSYAAKGSRRWRYYVSRAALRGRKQDAGSVIRVPAAQIEKQVEAMVKEVSDKDVVAVIERVIVGGDTLTIHLTGDATPAGQDRILTVPWKRASPYRRREIIQGDGASSSDARPMRVEARAAFAQALRHAHRWLDELTRDPEQSIEKLAIRESKSERSIRMTLSLAFVAPPIVAAAVEGRLPRGFGVKRLMDLPMAWSQQWTALGLEPRDA